MGLLKREGSKRKEIESKEGGMEKEETLSTSKPTNCSGQHRGCRFPQLQNPRPWLPVDAACRAGSPSAAAPGPVGAAARGAGSWGCCKLRQPHGASGVGREARGPKVGVPSPAEPPAWPGASPRAFPSRRCVQAGGRACSCCRGGRVSPSAASAL